MSKNPLAVEEEEKLCRKTFEDGVSVIAQEKASGKIVTVAFCKMQVGPGGKTRIHICVIHIVEKKT